MALNDNNVTNSFNWDVIDSGNVVSEETTNNLELGATDSFNEETTTVGINDSFNQDSNDVDVDGSFNEDNLWVDASDNSINDSGNSFSYTDNSVDDHSINAGNREYNTGYEGGAAGAAAGHGGWGNATIVDQSINANISAEGSVAVGSANVANVASGEGAVAAGGNVSVSTSLDASTNLSAGGDLNIGNETSVISIEDSFNTVEYTEWNEDNSVNVDITDSWNDSSESYSVDGSFNTAELFQSETGITVDLDAIVDSTDSVIGSEISF